IEFEELERIFGCAGAADGGVGNQRMAVGVLLIETDNDGLLAQAADGNDDLPGVARFEALPAGRLGDRADELLRIGGCGSGSAAESAKVGSAPLPYPSTRWTRPLAPDS